MKTKAIFAALTAAFIVIMAGSALAQDKTPKLYKWVDSQGVTHYGSSVPPQYANQQLQVLNSQGITVKTVNAAKTPEELAAEKQKQVTAAQETKAEQEQHALDQMLLDTYTSVADIQEDRKTRIKAMDAQIKVTASAIAGLESSLQGYEKQRSTLARSHRPIPASLQKDLASSQQELSADRGLLDQQTQQKQAMEERFDGYVKRFQELTKDQNSSG